LERGEGRILSIPIEKGGGDCKEGGGSRGKKNAASWPEKGFLQGGREEGLLKGRNRKGNRKKLSTSEGKRGKKKHIGPKKARRPSCDPLLREGGVPLHPPVGTTSRRPEDVLAALKTAVGKALQQPEK